MSAKDTLRSNKTDIELILSADRQLILRKVYEKRLVTVREYLNLKNIYKETEEGHVIDLVDKIMGKGEARCGHFVDLLQSDEEIKETFPELQDKLSNYTGCPHRPTQETSSAENSDEVEPKGKKRKLDEVYPLDSEPTGICFIINNVNFNDNKPRHGSDVDAETVADTFSELGFRVLMCKDQTKDEMERVLKCLSSASDISKLQDFSVKEWSDRKFTDLQEAPAHGDAFICCILTHGNTGVVCGIDRETLSIKEVKKTFKATDQSPLTNKPKVFLIQACQGVEPHGRVVLPDLQSDTSIPEESDFLTAMATVEDYESYRHTLFGSWFIQSFCAQLKEGCPRGEDIYAVLQRVNNEVSLKEGETKKRPGVILKQMPEFRSTLRKKLVLSRR